MRAATREAGRRPLLHSRFALLLAFAFAVMADPVSSVAYAIEAALRALDGDLALLGATMGLVVAIIALVILNYRQLVGRYPQGGGASAAVGRRSGTDGPSCRSGRPWWTSSSRSRSASPPARLP